MPAVYLQIAHREVILFTHFIVRLIHGPTTGLYKLKNLQTNKIYGKTNVVITLLIIAYNRI